MSRRPIRRPPLQPSRPDPGVRVRLRRRPPGEAVTEASPPGDVSVTGPGNATTGTEGPTGAVVNPLDDPEFVAGLRTVPSGVGVAPVPWSAADISGVTPEGAPLVVEFGTRRGTVLLVFLSTHCDGCDVFWRGARDAAPAEVDIVIVTKGPGGVSAAEVGQLAEGMATPVVLSDRAWTDYRVTGYPFLVLVDPTSRKVLGESVGFGWSDIATLLDQARDH